MEKEKKKTAFRAVPSLFMIRSFPDTFRRALHFSITALLSWYEAKTMTVMRSVAVFVVCFMGGNVFASSSMLTSTSTSTLALASTSSLGNIETLGRTKTFLTKRAFNGDDNDDNLAPLDDDDILARLNMNVNDLNDLNDLFKLHTGKKVQPQQLQGSNTQDGGLYTDLLGKLDEHTKSAGLTGSDTNIQENKWPYRGNTPDGGMKIEDFTELMKDYDGLTQPSGSIRPETNIREKTQPDEGGTPDGGTDHEVLTKLIRDYGEQRGPSAFHPPDYDDDVDHIDNFATFLAEYEPLKRAFQVLGLKPDRQQNLISVFVEHRREQMLEQDILIGTHNRQTEPSAFHSPDHNNDEDYDDFARFLAEYKPLKRAFQELELGYKRRQDLISVFATSLRNQMRYDVSNGFNREQGNYQGQYDRDPIVPLSSRIITDPTELNDLLRSLIDALKTQQVGPLQQEPHNGDGHDHVLNDLYMSLVEAFHTQQEEDQEPSSALHVSSAEESDEQEDQRLSSAVARSQREAGNDIWFTKTFRPETLDYYPTVEEVQRFRGELQSWFFDLFNKDDDKPVVSQNHVFKFGSFFYRVGWVNLEGLRLPHRSRRYDKSPLDYPVKYSRRYPWANPKAFKYPQPMPEFLDWVISDPLRHPPTLLQQVEIQMLSFLPHTNNKRESMGMGGFFTMGTNFGFAYRVWWAPNGEAIPKDDAKRRYALDRDEWQKVRKALKKSMYGDRPKNRSQAQRKELQKQADQAEREEHQEEADQAEREKLQEEAAHTERKRPQEQAPQEQRRRLRFKIAQ